MWFAEKCNGYFTEFGTLCGVCFFNSNSMSLCPITDREVSNQFVFANGMDYLKRSLKICKVKTS